MSNIDSNLDYLPHLGDKLDYAIGCIGAGFIMRDCHLLAYRNAGFNPQAIWSRDRSNAESAAEMHALPKVYDSYQELLADPELEVIDIAVPPQNQLEVVREMVKHGDHIRGVLLQKPVAMSYPDAVEVVTLCEDAGITVSVNQNMRYDQSMRALKCVLERGYLGEPVLATIDMRAIPHWMPWAEGLDSLSTYVMSIHHLDIFRYLFGDPDRVIASTRTDPRTKFAHDDGINLYILEYDSGLRAMSCDDVWAGPAREGGEPDIYIRWRVEGTDGMARGTIGWPDYPDGSPSTIDFTTNQHSGQWFQPRWPEMWFPDAFVGTMGQLLKAIETGSDPEINGRDNLDTLALVEATRRAAREHRAVTLGEVRDETTK